MVLTPFHPSRTRTPARLLLVSLLLLLGGCDRTGGSQTVGQRLDAAVVKGEQKLDGLKAESGTADERLSETAKELGGEVKAAASDASTTARVKAKLAADSTLNALKIDVDSSAGRVSLSGTAPSAAARDRAGALAKSVDGVTAVENRLQVEPPAR